jgi:hypothetical protein
MITKIKSDLLLSLMREDIAKILVRKCYLSNIQNARPIADEILKTITKTAEEYNRGRGK